jgi:hypothetical protein
MCGNDTHIYCEYQSCGNETHIHPRSQHGDARVSGKSFVKSKILGVLVWKRGG